MSFNLFKSELKRLVQSNAMLLVFIFAIALIVLQYMTGNDYTDLDYKAKYPLDVSNLAFLYMIGFDGSGMGTNLYIMLFPFIAALVGSSLYAEDRRSNFLLAATARTSPKAYTLTSAAASFVAGGIAVNVPYLLQSWICFMQYPTTAMDRFNTWMPFTSDFWGYKLFTWQPLSVWGIYLVIFFLFGGIYSLIGYLVSYITTAKYLETIFPFLLHTAIWLILSLSNFIQYSPTILLSPIHSAQSASRGWPNGLALLFMIPVLLIFLAAIIWRKSYDEVL